jgi:hypothetical protein
MNELMTSSETTGEKREREFLPKLLAFLASRRFFPDVRTDGGRFAFRIAADPEYDYRVRGTTTAGSGLTSYEIVRLLAFPIPEGKRPVERVVRFAAIFGALNQPFAISLTQSDGIALTCTGLHQSGAPFDFMDLSVLFDAHVRRIRTALDRLSKLDLMDDEIVMMVDLLWSDEASESFDAR